MARRLTKEQIISNVYYDLEKGFGSIQDTLKQAKEQDPSITRVDVETFMKNNPTNRLEVIGIQTHLPPRSQGLSIKLT